MASVPAGPTAQKLRYKFAAGQVDKYRIDVGVKVDSPEPIPELSKRTLRGTGRNTYRTLKVNPNGTAHLAVDVEPLTLRGSRQDPSLVTQHVELVMTPLGESASAKLVRGKAVSTQSLLLDPSALSRLGAVLPARPVSPGDRWTTTAPNPFQPAGKITVTNRYFLADRFKGKFTARIHQTMNIPIGLRLSQPGGSGIVRVHGALKVNTAIQFSPTLGKILQTSSFGAGTVRLTPLEDKTGKDSIAVTLNVDAVAEIE
jgi:hypothetical protein